MTKIYSVTKGISESSRLKTLTVLLLIGTILEVSYRERYRYEKFMDVVQRTLKPKDGHVIRRGEVYSSSITLPSRVPSLIPTGSEVGNARAGLANLISFY